MYIRPARVSDALEISACVNAAYEHYVERIGKQPGPMLDDYVSVIKDHDVFVLIDRGDFAGVVVLICSDEGALLDNVAVHIHKQGKGIGKRLIEFAESEAKRQGHAHLDLYTHEKMTENLIMYEKLGYTKTDRRTVKGYQRIYMRKLFL